MRALGFRFVTARVRGKICICLAEALGQGSCGLTGPKGKAHPPIDETISIPELHGFRCYIRGDIGVI